jgi:hypothetical protein
VKLFAPFISEPGAPMLTPRQKAGLAMRNIVSPFTAITILATSAVAVGSDSHSAYGPGMKGFGKYVGVAYTQDSTQEFFGTFLIPAIAHQDPRYYRMPHATVRRRILNTMVSVVWSRSDTGRGMPNYAILVGYAIEDEIGNLYVPGRETDLPSSASRYGIALASTPLTYLVIEFLPDVTKRVRIPITPVQRIINQLARSISSNH